MSNDNKNPTTSMVAGFLISKHPNIRLQKVHFIQKVTNGTTRTY